MRARKGEQGTERKERGGVGGKKHGSGGGGKGLGVGESLGHGTNGFITHDVTISTHFQSSIIGFHTQEITLSFTFTVPTSPQYDVCVLG